MPKKAQKWTKLEGVLKHDHTDVRIFEGREKCLPKINTRINNVVNMTERRCRNIRKKV